MSIISIRKKIAEFIYKPATNTIIEYERQTFFIDENSLGVIPHIEGKVQFYAVGNEGCPPLGTSDKNIMKFIKGRNLIVVTKDLGLIERCKTNNVPFISLPRRDEQQILVHQILNYK